MSDEGHSLLHAINAALPEVHRRNLDEKSPAPARMMAAKGMVPLPPKEQLLVLAGFVLDSNQALANAAISSLQGLPTGSFQAALNGNMLAEAWVAIVPHVSNRDDVVEPLLISRKTPDAAVAFLAGVVSEGMVEIIANDQERCLRSEVIVRRLRSNAALSASTRDRVFDFLARAGAIYDDMPEFAEAIARLSPQEMSQVANKVALPKELAQYMDHETQAATTAPPAEPAAETVDADEEVPSWLDQLETTEDAPATENVPVDDGHQEKRISIQQLISSLNVAQKVALAMRGNKEARTLLVRETNRVVANAVIRSPRITEQEIVAVANSRSVSDEVVRIISQSKELHRSYAVKFALVKNPKTPPAAMTRFLSLLRQTDLKAVAKSKNVPGVVAAHAKRMLLSKTGGKG